MVVVIAHRLSTRTTGPSIVFFVGHRHRAIGHPCYNHPDFFERNHRELALSFCFVGSLQTRARARRRLCFLKYFFSFDDVINMRV